jgi:hypothetical protein
MKNSRNEQTKNKKVNEQNKTISKEKKCQSMKFFREVIYGMG